MAAATVLAPERKTPPSNAPLPPNIVISQDGEGYGAERPQSPPTLIPETETLSTRPTRGGVAYPFRLKVEEGEREVNASTVTLQSVGVGSMGEAEEEREEGVGLLRGDHGKEEEGSERPGVERFVTASMGDLTSDVTSVGKGDNLKGKEKEEERPGVERFVTANEDLGALAGRV